MNIILQRFGALVCALRGHKRRVLVRTVLRDDKRYDLFYSCPRCGDEVRRIKREGK